MVCAVNVIPHKTAPASSQEPKTTQSDKLWECDYTNDGKRITQPGKFEGEPIFAPHYWSIALEGFADSDDGKVFGFRFKRRELANPLTPFGPAIKAWLGRKTSFKLIEDSQGFVHCI